MSMSTTKEGRAATACIEDNRNARLDNEEKSVAYRAWSAAQRSDGSALTEPSASASAVAGWANAADGATEKDVSGSGVVSIEWSRDGQGSRRDMRNVAGTLRAGDHFVITAAAAAAATAAATQKAAEKTTPGTTSGSCERDGRGRGCRGRGFHGQGGRDRGYRGRGDHG